MKKRSIVVRPEGTNFVTGDPVPAEYFTGFKNRVQSEWSLDSSDAQVFDSRKEARKVSEYLDRMYITVVVDPR